MSEETTAAGWRELDSPVTTALPRRRVSAEEPPARGAAPSDPQPAAPAAATGVRRRVTSYALLFTVVLCSGFLNQLVAAKSSFYQLNLAIHPILGVLATVTIIATLFRRIRAEVPAFGPAHLASFVLMCFVALVRSFTMAHASEQSSNLLTYLLSPLLAASTFYFLLRTVPLVPRLVASRNGSAHLTLLCLWMLALLVGVLIASNALRGRVPVWMFPLHAALGYGAATVGSLVLFKPAWRRLRESGLLPGICGGLALYFGARFVVDEVAALHHDGPNLAPVTVHLSVLPSAAREPADRDALPFAMDASWIEITESCLGAACHADLEDGFRHSLHNISYRPEHIHKVLDLLASELGAGETAMCAGCHVPGSLFTGGPSAAAYRERTNLPCVFCHSVSEAVVDDHQRSRYTLAPKLNALTPYRSAELAGESLPGWRRMAIQLNTEAHGKTFTPAILMDDAFCLACHHSQILPLSQAPSPHASPTSGAPSSEGTAADAAPEQRCVACHLPPLQTTGPEPERRDHFFPGSNATTPAILGLDGARRFTERWMQSQLLVRTFEDLYKTRDAVRRLGDERKDAFFYADLSASFAAPPRVRETAALTVTTRNLGMGHPFPASSLGLAEAWLEVRVTDASGRAIFASGGLDERQRILAGSHTLGGRLLDASGAPIDRYRVWAAAHEVIDRQIPYPGSVQDHFTFQVPADAERHLNVDAVWRYRKLGQDFWEWAYPERAEIPSSEVVRTFTQFPLG